VYVYFFTLLKYGKKNYAILLFLVTVKTLIGNTWDNFVENLKLKSTYAFIPEQVINLILL